jgi:hypothetical protein
MPYTPSPNEPMYNGVYLGQLLDQPIYASNAVSGIDILGNIIYSFKSGDFIGTLDSWANSGNDTFMIFYRTQADKDNFNPFYVKIGASTTSPAIQQIKDAAKAATEASKPILNQYLDKYLPWIVGGVVVAVALPTVANTVLGRNTQKKIGAMTKPINVSLVLAAIALIAFKKAKKPNTIILGPVEDITDWSNENANILTPIKASAVLPHELQTIPYNSYNGAINGIEKNNQPKYTC